MHRHRRIKLGRFGEAKVCLKCKRSWVDFEELHKSRLIDMLGGVIGKPQPVFTEEEMDILRSIASEKEASENGSGIRL